MAKSKWEHVKDKLILVEGWARDGLTDIQIAENLGISKDTFYEYKKKYTDFSDSLKRGKEVVDYEVENALLKNALRGNITAQIFWLKNRKPEKWKNTQNIKHEGNIGTASLPDMSKMSKEELLKLAKLGDGNDKNNV